MAEREKRRATTFRTSKGTVVNVQYPDIYISPAFLSSEDVTSPTELRETLREVLGENVSPRARSWLFPRVRPGENGVMMLKDYNGTLYGFQNISGIIYKLDDKEGEWVQEYDGGGVGPLCLAYGGYVSRLFNRLYLGHFTFNGTTWQTISGFPPGFYPCMAYRDFNGKLYSVFEGDRGLYESSDGVNFSQVWTAPAIETSELRYLGLHTEGNVLALYIGGRFTNAAPIYKMVAGGTPALDYTTISGTVDNLISMFGHLIAFGSGGAYDRDIYLRSIPYGLAWTRTGYGMPFSNMFDNGDGVFYMGGLMFCSGWGGLYKLNMFSYHNLIAQHVLAGPHPVTVELHKGKLYVGCETPLGAEDTGAQVHELTEISTKEPAYYVFHGWRGRAIADLVNGATTIGYPTVGDKKTFSLLSDQSGTVTLEVDMHGTGRWSTLYTEAVTANVLWARLTEYQFAWGRLKFVPSVAASDVWAWLAVG